jgi:hypothetical protein
VPDNVRTLDRYNLELLQKNDTTTSVFRRIKFAPKEASSSHAGATSERDKQPFPSEDSLQVRTEYPVLVVIRCVLNWADFFWCLLVAVLRAHAVRRYFT